MVSHKFKDALKTGKETAEHKEGDIAVLAYHAKTEEGTGDVAEDISKNSNASLYVFEGKRVPSTKITPTNSEDLNRMVQEKRTAVSMHAYHKQGNYEKQGKKYDYKDTVFVSGQNSELAKKIATELEDSLGHEYHIETNPDYIPAHLKGMSKHNIANKFKEGGVQVEMPRKLRESEEQRKYVSDSISTVINKEGKEEGPDLKVVEGKKPYKGKDYKEEQDTELKNVA